MNRGDFLRRLWAAPAVVGLTGVKQLDGTREVAGGQVVIEGEGRHITIRNCVFNGPDTAIAIRAPEA